MKTKNSKRRTGAFGGGMGAVATMKRSATDVEMLAGSDARRGTNSSSDEASAACHDKQIGVGVPPRKFLM